jgi:hypothetical protein
MSPQAAGIRIIELAAQRSIHEKGVRHSGL